jgi:DNA-binding transcriptional MerR regulator
MSDPAGLERRGLPPKLYFRIGEVAELVGVEPHVLRYWEREFRTIRPTKSAKGQRVYSRRDVENLMRVRELLYKEGFTIAGAKKKLVAGASRDEDRESFEPESDTAPGPATTTATDGDARVPPALGDDPGRTRDQLLAMRDEIESFLTELG